MNLLHRFIRAGRPVRTGSSQRFLAYVIPAQRSRSSAFLQVNKYSSVSVWIAANSLIMWAQEKPTTRAHGADTALSAAPAHTAKG